MNELILLRGIPGAGKTEFAKTYLADQAIHIEADDFFINDEGVYEFNIDKIAEAHKWCRDTTRILLIHGNPVVVANTFSQKWELQPYVDMAMELNITFRILTAHGNYGSVHNIPQKTMQKIIERWENDLFV